VALVRSDVLDECQFLQEPHDVTSQKMAFFIVTAVKTSNLTKIVFFIVTPRVTDLPISNLTATSYKDP
jgi:hypothetical protein